MATNTQNRQWVTVKEIASELRVSPSLVYRAIERGELPALRLSEHGAIRVPRSALEPKEER
jgi:excisionase family DNA binding protein